MLTSNNKKRETPGRKETKKTRKKPRLLMPKGGKKDETPIVPNTEKKIELEVENQRALTHMIHCGDVQGTTHRYFNIFRGY